MIVCSFFDVTISDSRLLGSGCVFSVTLIMSTVNKLLYINGIMIYDSKRKEMT